MDTIEAPLAGRSILVVEDDPDVAFDLSEGLRLAGAAMVDIKASMRQACRRLTRSALPDVVIIDHDLATEDTGTAFALWLRSYDVTNQTLRVSYSGSEPETVRETWPDDQVCHLVITKPVDLVDLVGQIAAAWQQLHAVPDEAGVPG